MIKITFHGAAGEVTGSRHLIETDHQTLLLDCGLYQGRRKDTYERNLNFPFDPAAINYLILSHAHIDHIGDVPNLVKKGFNGNIYCTPATADLLKIMLMDSAHIQESDAVFATKIRSKHHEPPVEPLYRVADIPPILQLLRAKLYDQPFMLNGVSAVFREAGHIVGSAITVLGFNDQGRKVSVCYTGDLGRPNMPIVKDPYVVTDADILIIESTYGDRLHADIRDVSARLAKVINETVQRGGKVIVPSFALERTQELVYTLHLLKNAHQIPDIPVYVDSPLAIDATEIFRIHDECFDEEVSKLAETTNDPFGFRHLHYTRTTEESKQLNLIDSPVIIIAGSGMAENGRILHHLKNNIGNPLNTVLIVGYQSENTLGRKIQDKLPEVRIFGEPYALKCQVEVFSEFSAHADRNDLLAWIKPGQDRWQKVFLVHGENQAEQSLAKDLVEMGIREVIVPQFGQSYLV
jgi:metallo-beta-lactamase family protein